MPSTIPSSSIVADSAEATGLKWAAPSGGSFVGVVANSDANITLSNNTDTVLNWNTETFDTDAFHSTVTNNSRITIPSGKGGKYRIYAKVIPNTNNTSQDYSVQLKLRKNGSTIVATSFLSNAQYAATTLQLFVLIELVATDYLEILGTQNSGGSLGITYANDSGEFSAEFLGA